MFLPKLPILEERIYQMSFNLKKKSNFPDTTVDLYTHDKFSYGFRRTMDLRTKINQSINQSEKPTYVVGKTNCSSPC